MNDNNDYGLKGYGCVTMFVSGVAIILSIISLLKWDDKLCNVSGENITIAVLSALITFVVAWQIWQTMASREEIRKAEIVGEKYSEIVNKLSIAENAMACIHYINLGEKKYAEGYYDDALRNFAEALVIVNEKPTINYKKELYTALDLFLTDHRNIEISYGTKIKMISGLYSSSYSRKRELIQYIDNSKIMVDMPHNRPDEAARKGG
ncbi:MAG: hypothetical protein HFJ91_00815 [Muribaculaceae bacterium]|nr:hypothetical protein [Muribaculaceae bacterium]